MVSNKRQKGEYSMGWINSHVMTTKPITDINGCLIPKGSELMTIYGTKRGDSAEIAGFRSCENGRAYKIPWAQTEHMKILPEKLIMSSAFL